MAGTLIINESYAWMPANWLFLDVMEECLKKVPETDTPLKAKLARASLTTMADLSDLDGPSFRSLIPIVDLIHTEAVAAGPRSFRDPAFYPGYIKWIDELRAQLKADPRAEDAAR